MAVGTQCDHAHPSPHVCPFCLPPSRVVVNRVCDQGGGVSRLRDPLGPSDHGVCLTPSQEAGVQGGWAGLGTVFFTSCQRLSHGRHQGNSARYDGSTRLQVGHWYLPHLMVSKTPRWVCGCWCVLRSDPHPQGQAQRRCSDGRITVRDSATDPDRRDQKEKNEQQGQGWAPTGLLNQ